MCSLQESYSSVGSGLVIFSLKTNMQFNFSDARITFLEGTHLLDREEPIKISQVTDLTLIGRGHWVRGPEETIMESTAVIYCTRGRGGFAIYDSSQISIINLSLINCGAFHTNAQVKSSITLSENFRTESSLCFDTTCRCRNCMLFICRPETVPLLNTK